MPPLAGQPATSWSTAGLADPVVAGVPELAPADEEAVEVPAEPVLEPLLHAASSRAATVASGTITATPQRLLGVGPGLGTGRPEDLRPPNSAR